MITITLLDGDKVHTRSIDGYRLPNPLLGDNPDAKTMVHTLGCWLGVKEDISEIESLAK